MDMVNAKVAVDKSCEELTARCQELNAGRNLSKPAKRVVIEEYMQSSFFKFFHQEMARRSAAMIREDLRSRHPSMDLSFMSLRYGIGPELPPLASRPPLWGERSSPSFEVFRGCTPFEIL